MAGGFLKRSIHSSIEAEGDALDAELGDDGVAVQRGARRLANRQALLGVDTSQVVLRYTHARTQTHILVGSF